MNTAEEQATRANILGFTTVCKVHGLSDEQTATLYKQACAIQSKVMTKRANLMKHIEGLVCTPATA